MRESNLRKQAEDKLENIGISFEYGSGKLGEYLNETINLEHMLIMHLFDFSYHIATSFCKYLNRDIRFDVLYPSDGNSDFCITLDDLSCLLNDTNDEILVDALWKAIVERDINAVEYINKNTSATIGYKCQSVETEPQNTKHDIYNQLAVVVEKMNVLLKAFNEAGFMYRSNNGAFSDFIDIQNDNFEDIIMLCMDLKLVAEDIAKTDESYYFLKSINIIYPVDDDVSVSVTEDDLLSAISELTNNDLAENFWKAIVNKDDNAKEWIHNNSKIKIGPVGGV